MKFYVYLIGECDMDMLEFREAGYTIEKLIQHIHTLPMDARADFDLEVNDGAMVRVRIQEGPFDTEALADAYHRGYTDAIHEHVHRGFDNIDAFVIGY
jgi:hypothetical protein